MLESFFQNRSRWIRGICAVFVISALGAYFPLLGQIDRFYRIVSYKLVIPFTAFPLGIFLGASFVIKGRCGKAFLLAALVSLFAFALAIHRGFPLDGFLLFSLTIALLGFAGIALSRWAFKVTVPFWAGILLCFAFLYQLVLFLGLVGRFDSLCLGVTVAALCVLGAFEALRAHRSGEMGWSNGLDGVNASEGVLWAASISIFFLTAVGSAAPETAFDAMRSYVPFMERLAREHRLIPNYYYWYDLTYLAVHTLGAVGDMFLGQAGAKWATGWVYAWICYLMIREEARRLGCSRTISTAAAFAWISIPEIFFSSTTAYYDIAFSAFSVGGLFLFRRGVKASDATFLPAIILIAFSWLCKPSAVFYAGTGIALICYSYRVEFLRTVRDLPSRLVAGLTLAFLVVAPRMMVSAHWTGNPVYPFFHALFNPKYAGFSSTLLPGKDFFRFPHGIWIDLPFLPAIITFFTSYFVEESRGECGVSFLLFSPLIYGLFSRVSRSNENTAPSRTDALLLVLMGLIPLVLISVLHAPYLRYWYPSFILFAVAAAIGAERLVSPGINLHSNRVAMIFSFFMVALFVAQAPFALQRAGFIAGRWRPWALATGKVSIEEFSDQSYSKVPFFVNRYLKAGENVISTNYYGNSLIAAHVFDSVPWWDVFNGLESNSDFEKLIREQNVRLWIVGYRANWIGIYDRRGFDANFWLGSRKVYDDGTYRIYDLKIPSTRG